MKKEPENLSTPSEILIKEIKTGKPINVLLLVVIGVALYKGIPVNVNIESKQMSGNILHTHANDGTVHDHEVGGVLKGDYDCASFNFTYEKAEPVEMDHDSISDLGDKFEIAMLRKQIIDQHEYLEDFKKSLEKAKLKHKTICED